jgi:hypothetical protein
MILTSPLNVVFFIEISLHTIEMSPFIMMFPIVAVVNCSFVFYRILRAPLKIELDMIVLMVMRVIFPMKLPPLMLIDDAVTLKSQL